MFSNSHFFLPFMKKLVFFLRIKISTCGHQELEDPMISLQQQVAFVVVLQ